MSLRNVRSALVPFARAAAIPAVFLLVMPRNFRCLAGK